MQISGIQDILILDILNKDEMQPLSHLFQKNLYTERDILKSAHLDVNASSIASGYMFLGKLLHLSEPKLPCL